MHFSHATLLLLALFLTVVLSFPTTSTEASNKKGGSFVVKRVPNGSKKMGNGAREMRKAYKKYGWAKPKSKPKAKTPSKPKPKPKPKPQPEAPNGADPNVLLADSSTPAANKKVTSPTGSAPSGDSTQGSSHGLKAAATVVTSTKDEREFLSPLLIGGQQFNINVDTGSADLYVGTCPVSAPSVFGSESSPYCTNGRRA